MKNIKIFNSFIMLLAAGMLLFASCETENTLPSDNTVPVFPEDVVTKNVAAGEDIPLTISPNMRWTASLSGEGAGSRFWIDDDGVKVSQISGRAGEHTVIVKFSDVDEFETLSCDLNLTMGDQTRKIATYTRNAGNRAFNLYAAEADETTFKMQEKSYVYGTSAVKEVALATFPETCTYTLPVKIESNFAWRLAHPDWVSVDGAAQGEAGETELLLSAVLFSEESAGAEGVLKFYDASSLEVQAEVKLSLPSFNDRMEFTINSLTFSKEAQALMPSGSFSEDPMPIIAYLLATEGAQIKALACSETGHDKEFADWVTVTPGFDPSAGLLQSYPVELTVPVNEGPERFADLFAFPEALANVTAQQICDPEDPTCIKEEYRKYHMGVLTQQGIIPPYISPISTEELMLEVGTYYTIMEAAAEENVLQWDFAESPSYHRFIYTTPYSHEEATFECTKPFAKCVLYMDSDYPAGLFAEPVAEGQECWLEFVAMEDNKKGRFNIVSVPSESVQTAAVFYDEADAILGAVLIRYDAASSGVEEFMLSMEAGEAELIKRTEESDIYAAFASEYSVTDVYELTTSADALLLASSEAVASYMVNQPVPPFAQMTSSPFGIELIESKIMISNADVAESTDAVIVLKDENLLNRAVIYYHYVHVPPPVVPDPENPGEGGEGGEGGDGPENPGEGGEGGEGGDGPENPGEGGEGGEGPENPGEGGEGGEGGDGPENPGEGGEEDDDEDIEITVDPAELFKLDSGTAEILKLDAESELLRKMFKKYSTTQVYQVTTISRKTTITLSAGYEIYGGVRLDAATLEETTGGIVSMEPMDGQIVMYSGGATTRQEAVYVLLDVNEKAIAVVHYIFDPEADIEIVPAFEFAYPANVKGAVLNRYSGEDIQALLEEFPGVESYNVYELTYTVASPTRPHLKVPSMPATGYAWGNEAGSSTYWLTYTKATTANTIQIKMTQPGLTDKFLFKSSDGMFSHILICTYKPAN